MVGAQHKSGVFIHFRLLHNKAFHTPRVCKKCFALFMHQLLNGVGPACELLTIEPGTDFLQITLCLGDCLKLVLAGKGFPTHIFHTPLNMALLVPAIDIAEPEGKTVKGGQLQ